MSIIRRTHSSRLMNKKLFQKGKRPKGLWRLGAHPFDRLRAGSPDPLPEGSAPLDSPDGILR